MLELLHYKIITLSNCHCSYECRVLDALLTFVGLEILQSSYYKGEFILMERFSCEFTNEMTKIFLRYWSSVMWIKLFRIKEIFLQIYWISASKHFLFPILLRLNNQGNKIRRISGYCWRNSLCFWKYFSERLSWNADIVVHNLLFELLPIYLSLLEIGDSIDNFLINSNLTVNFRCQRNNVLSIDRDRIQFKFELFIRALSSFSVKHSSFVLLFVIFCIHFLFDVSLLYLGLEYSLFYLHQSVINYFCSIFRVR